MTLSSKQKIFLKAQAHHLKPVVSMGQKGLTEALVVETERALTAHELIKVRFHEAEGMKDAAVQLSSRVDAELVAMLGKNAILYRAHPERPKLRVPKDEAHG